MLAQDILSIVDKFVSRYNGYMSALVGEISRTIDGPDPTSVKARNSFTRNAEQMFTAALESEMLNLETQVEKIITSIRQELDAEKADLSGLVYISEEIPDIIAAIRDQMLRDGRTGARYLRDFAINVDMLLQSTNYAPASAQIVVRKSMELPMFTYMDRAGKRWKSDRYIQILIQSFLFRVYNEVYLYILAQQGVNLAVLRYTDANHPNQDRYFTVYSHIPGIISYIDVKETIFHPNSTVMVSK